MIKQDKRNTKKDFFNKLINQDNDTLHDVTHWIDYGKPFGIIQSSNYQIILGQIRIPGSLSYHSKTMMLLIQEWFDSKVDDYFEHAIFIPHNNETQIIILLQDTPSNLTDLLQRMHEELQVKLNINVVFGVGTLIKEISLARFSLSTATKALEEACLDKDSYIHYYQNKGISSLINDVSEDNIHYFCVTTLGKLAYPTSDNDKELRQTLKVYLDNQCRITETADELFIHRNTVKYRINKCNNLLEKNIESSYFSLQLRLALHLSSETN